MQSPAGSREPTIRLAVIVGPTSVGKTALSLELAEAIQGEVISADSRLVYRRMDIGTAKPTASERARVPHHLIDLVEPDQTITLAEYQRLAYEAIAETAHRRHTPLLVGGTGQYIRAVIEGWVIPAVPPSRSLRAELERYAHEQGAQALHQRLAQVDQDAAARIDPRNVRRVVRALEVSLLTGRPISELQAKSPPPFSILQVGLSRPRPVLYERIDRRIDNMLAAGLVTEVQNLAASGYGWELPAMSGLGYRQIGAYLRGEATLAEAVSMLRRDTRRLVRQQATWFRTDDPVIRWFDLELHLVSEVVSYVSGWLRDWCG